MKIWSQIGDMIVVLVHKVTLKKKYKKVKTQKTKNLESTLFIQSNLMDTLDFFLTKLRPYFQNSFP